MSDYGEGIYDFDPEDVPDDGYNDLLEQRKRERGNLYVAKRKNRDGSYVFYARPRATGPTERLCRTEANCGKRSLRQWERKAQQYCAEINNQREEIRRGRPWKLKIPVAVKMYLTWLRGDEEHAAQASEKTIEHREREVRGFAEYCMDKHGLKYMRSLSHKHTAGWRSVREVGLADASLRTVTSHLQDFLTFAYEQGWTHEHLVALPKRIKKQLKRQRTPHRLEDRDAMAMIRGQKRPERAASIFALFATGVRLSEALAIQPEQIHNGVIHVPVMGTERIKRHQRDIPIGPVLQQALEHGPLIQGTEHQIRYWLAPFDKSPHDCRRWYYTSLLKEGMPQPFAKRLVGHVLSASEEPYVLERNVEDFRPIIEAVEGRIAPALFEHAAGPDGGCDTHSHANSPVVLRFPQPGCRRDIAT